jgi:hypothetical protein
MKVVVQNKYEFITHDGYLFKTAQSDIGHNLLKPWNDLYVKGKERGIDFYTSDQLHGMAHHPKQVADVLICMDRPDRELYPAKKKIFIIYEPHFLVPGNWDKDFHEQFDLVLTWRDDLIDGRKYHKNNFTVDWSERVDPFITRERYNERKLAVLMNTAKAHPSASSLYGARITAINWFEEHAPNDFDLYGRGWQQCGYQSYRGAMDNKLNTLVNYNFNIAYENCNDQTGYITEKILDSFMAGVPPVYYGSAGVERHIPQDAYISVHDFKTYDDLFKYLKYMKYNEYQGYLQAIDRFITSDKAEQFSNDWFIERMFKFLEGL